jgi:hypothetical protein
MSADPFGSTPQKRAVIPMAPSPGMGRGMGIRSRTAYSEATANSAIDPVKAMVTRPKGIAASCKAISNRVRQ